MKDKVDQNSSKETCVSPIGRFQDHDTTKREQNISNKLLLASDVGTCRLRVMVVIDSNFN